MCIRDRSGLAIIWAKLVWELFLAMSELFLAISELFLALKNVRNLESKLSLAIFVCERVFDPDFESIFWMQLCKYKYPHFLKERFESEQIERVVQYEEGGGTKGIPSYFEQRSSLSYAAKCIKEHRTDIYQVRGNKW